MSECHENKSLLFSNSEDKLMYKKDEIIEEVKNAESTINKLYTNYPYFKFRLKKLNITDSDNKIIPQLSKKFSSPRISLSFKEKFQQNLKKEKNLPQNNIQINLKKININKGRNVNDNYIFPNQTFSTKNKTNMTFEHLKINPELLSKNFKISSSTINSKNKEKHLKSRDYENKSNYNLKNKTTSFHIEFNNKEEEKNKNKNFSEEDNSRKNLHIHQIYTQCNLNLDKGEKFKNLMKRQKNKSIELEKKKIRIYKNKLKKIEDQILIDNENISKFSKGIISKLMGKKTLKKNYIKHKKELQKLKIDIVPKINENLAYNHRNFYMEIFDYDYQNDDDFLFIKDFLKVKEKQYKLALSAKKINTHLIYKDCQMEQILHNNLIEKNNLIERINKDQIKCLKENFTNIKSNIIEKKKEPIKIKLKKNLPRLNNNQNHINVNKFPINSAGNLLDHKKTFDNNIYSNDDFDEFKITLSQGALSKKA